MGLVYRLSGGIGNRKVIALTEFDRRRQSVRSHGRSMKVKTPLMSRIERDQMHRPERVVEPDNIELLLAYAGPRFEVKDRRGLTPPFIATSMGRLRPSCRNWLRPTS